MSSTFKLYHIAPQAISRLYVNKAHFISMNSQLTEQLGMAKVAGTLSKSTEIMALVNDLMRAPQLMQTMQQMSKEMMKVCKQLPLLHRDIIPGLHAEG